MNDRERFINCISGEAVDRPPFWLFWGPWNTTRKRWEGEGMPAGLMEPASIFDPDARPRVLPVNLGPCPPILRTCINEDGNYVIFIDEWGIKRRDYKHGESMSDFLEFPVKTAEDWKAFRDRWLDPDDIRRLEGNWQELGRQWMDQGYPIQLGDFPNAGVYGPFRWLMGDESGLIALHTMPGLAYEMMDHITSIYLCVFEQVVKKVRVDVIHFWEDMCYKGGPLISPKMWEEFLGPCYRRIKAFADQHNIPILSVDTDGNPDKIAPAMMRAGINYLFPMEVAAGCDVNAWQKKYPTLGMMGGIDKRVLARGKRAIDVELERVRPAIEKGRYIPELDHLIPDDVSWENYCYYAEALKKMVGKP